MSGIVLPTNPNIRPTAPENGGLLPRFGMFAGQGYTGGVVWADGVVPEAAAWDVAPISFLDAVTRNHDLSYTYIEQVYRGDDPATVSARMVGAFAN